jgi:hypothetical protein
MCEGTFKVRVIVGLSWILKILYVRMAARPNELVLRLSFLNRQNTESDRLEPPAYSGRGLPPKLWNRT